MELLAFLIEFVVGIASEMVPAQKTFGRYVLLVLGKSVVFFFMAVLAFILVVLVVSYIVGWSGV